jgi:phenylacetate-CoA ligase
MLIIRGINIFPSQVEEVILMDQRLSPHYVLEVTRDGRLDKLTVLVEQRPDRDGCDDDFRARLAADLIQQFKSVIGISVAARVLPVGEIERSMGKAKRIIDKR